MHEHFDAAGNLTGTTVVTRESEWDDSARGRAMQLAEHERMTDRQTGLPIEQAYDPDQTWRVNYTTNFASRAIERVRKDHADLPEHKDKPNWAAGRTYYAEPVDLPAAAPDDAPAPD